MLPRLVNDSAEAETPYFTLQPKPTPAPTVVYITLFLLGDCKVIVPTPPLTTPADIELPPEVSKLQLLGFLIVNMGI
jgi:hypothetical protein